MKDKSHAMIGPNSYLEDLGLRCDLKHLKPNCLDQSDEFNCHSVVIEGE